jgi:hypothetical protein
VVDSGDPGIQEVPKAFDDRHTTIPGHVSTSLPDWHLGCRLVSELVSNAAKSPPRPRLPAVVPAAGPAANRPCPKMR